jgi:steroid delta-isomerase-like uncharacterized protein
MTTTATAQSIEKFVARRFDTANRHDVQAWASTYSSDAVVFDPGYPEPLRGTDAIAKDFADFITAFPDLKITQGLTLVDGDNYAMEYTISGTHTGPLVTPSGRISATNKRIDVPGSAFGRIDAAGRSADERRYYDFAGILGQLGLMH